MNKEGFYIHVISDDPSASTKKATGNARIAGSALNI
jgi:hypothetical protein